MTKKEKFIKLVELETARRHNGKGYIPNNVSFAMFVKESCIPDETGNEELLIAAKDFVSYQLDGDERPEWLEYEEGTFDIVIGGDED